MQYKPIAEQVIFITGASSGIGLTTARRSAKKGAKVFLFSRDANELGHIADEINDSGGRAHYFAGDVADRSALEVAAEEAERHLGPIDTWVNNAGVSIYGRIVDVPLDDQRRVFETNYWGVVHGSLVAVERMRGRKGVLINIGSVLSDVAIPLQGPYCATKHAVKAFPDALRLELEADGEEISVSLVKPGAIATPFHEQARNYTEHETRNPPPVYAPDIVADSILRMAERPQRDVYVGGGGRLFSIFGQLAPRTADRALEKAMFRLQQGSKPPEPRQDNLYRPPNDPARERDRYPGPVLERSLYTAVMTRPLAGLALTAIALFALGALTARLTS
jgi:short-subunit dehydrogenase